MQVFMKFGFYENPKISTKVGASAAPSGLLSQRWMRLGAELALPANLDWAVGGGGGGSGSAVGVGVGGAFCVAVHPKQLGDGGAVALDLAFEADPAGEGGT